MYREEWALYPGAAGGASVTDELVLIQDESYGSTSSCCPLELNGKVALRIPGRVLDPEGLAREVALAAGHGASALILPVTGVTRNALLSKEPLPATLSLSGTLPVLQLSPEGYQRLLRSAGYMEGKGPPSVPAVPLGLTVRVEVPLSAPQTVEEANVLGMLPGSDPELGKELVIVGAHYDHVGDDPDLILCQTSGAGEASDAQAICKPGCRPAVSGHERRC